jgi:hypothetical protein
MITILLACALSTATPAGADEAAPESVKELSLTVEGNGYTADLRSPAPVIAACEAEDGHLAYGPAEDIAVWWRDGVLTVNPGPTYVDCVAWTWR